MLFSVLMQDMDYSLDSVLGVAPTWPQMAACLPSDIQFDWEGDAPLQTPLEELVIYELHVRGFTQHPSAAAIASGGLVCSEMQHSSELRVKKN